MTSNEDQLRSSFGSAAVAYARHRPDYAPEAVAWALMGARGRRVLDLGAGTGKLTSALAERGCEVVAVEPDPAMLAILRDSLSTDVTALQGEAEAIPIPDCSVDAVVAGNAMHWFDMGIAAAEIARVLTPGGVVAGLWNVMDDQVDWVAELAVFAGQEAIGPRDTPTSWAIEADRLHLSMNASDELFGPAEQQQFVHGQSRTVESLVATLSTKAGMLIMSTSERERRLTQIRQYLSQRQETGSGEFVLPMFTAVMRTRRVQSRSRLGTPRRGRAL